MKIRSAFVSNSSTSSFCIVGFRFDSFKEILSLLRHEDTRFRFDSVEYEYGGANSTILQEFFEEKDFSFLVGGYNDNPVLIGRTIKSMKKTQTLQKFESEVKSDMGELISIGDRKIELIVGADVEGEIVCED